MYGNSKAVTAFARSYILPSDLYAKCNRRASTNRESAVEGGLQCAAVILPLEFSTLLSTIQKYL